MFSVSKVLCKVLSILIAVLYYTCGWRLWKFIVFKGYHGNLSDFGDGCQSFVFYVYENQWVFYVHENQWHIEKLKWA